MSITIAPSTSYEATLESGTTGLVGTLKLGVYDGQGGVTSALATTGIIETPAGSGVYVATRTAPGTAGQYVLVWSLDGTTDPDQVITEDLVVTGEALVTIGGTSSVYITRAQLKARLEIPSADTQFDDELDVAREAASRCCDGYKHTRFYPTTETRYYAGPHWDTAVQIDELNTLTSLTLDFDGDGTYETTWTEGTEFMLEPQNYTADGIPADRVVLNERSTARFPIYRRSIKITGSFGWAETPVNVVGATMLIAVRLFKRRETPYAIMSVIAAEAVAAARLGNIDPDAKNLLDSIPGAQTPVLASLQLG